MAKEFYSDAIKLMRSFARGNQSSKTIVGGDGGKGRMRGKAPKATSTTTGGGRPPVRGGGRRKGGKV